MEEAKKHTIGLPFETKHTMRSYGKYCGYYKNLLSKIKIIRPPIQDFQTFQREKATVQKRITIQLS